MRTGQKAKASNGEEHVEAKASIRRPPRHLNESYRMKVSRCAQMWRSGQCSRTPDVFTRVLCVRSSTCNHRSLTPVLCACALWMPCQPTPDAARPRWIFLRFDLAPYIFGIYVDIILSAQCPFVHIAHATRYRNTSSNTSTCTHRRGSLYFFRFPVLNAPHEQP